MPVDLEALRRAAEAEMLRAAPDRPGGPPAKRQRRHAGDLADDALAACLPAGQTGAAFELQLIERANLIQLI